MDIKKLSTKYKVQKLGQQNANEILEAMGGNPMYFQYCPPAPTTDSILEDMQALPPGKNYEDKYYLGIYDGDTLLAVLDLILQYPDAETAFIGFFMLNPAYQGKGIGTLIVSDILNYIYTLGYKHVRLGYVKGNPQARAFWLRNSFYETGEEGKTEDYTIVVMQRDEDSLLRKDIKQLETEHLILKKPVFDDWKSMYHNLWRHKETAKYMLWAATKSEEEAMDRMRRSIQFQHKRRDAYFVYEKATGQGIGFAGMVEVKPGVYEDSGIALGPEYVGKGFGKEILRAFINEAKSYGAKEFVCSCRSANVASARLQQSCGLTFDHSEERMDPRDGTPYQLDFYNIMLV